MTNGIRRRPIEAQKAQKYLGTSKRQSHSAEKTRRKDPLGFKRLFQTFKYEKKFVGCFHEISEKTRSKINILVFKKGKKNNQKPLL